MTNSAPIVGDTMTAAVSQPPIVYVAQLIGRILTSSLLAFSFIPKVFVLAIQAVLFPFTAISAPFFYIIAPVVVLAQILAEVLILAPYRVFTYLATALYPVYVLAGTAVLTAALVGLTGRFITSSIISFLFRPPRDDEPTDAADAQYIAPRRKVKKVTIKEEKRPMRI